MAGIWGGGLHRSLRRRVGALLVGGALGVGAAGGVGAAEGRLGKVVQVYDGDTVTVFVGGEFFGAQLFGIDAPELRQAHGDVAAARLKSLVADREVRLVVLEPDGEGTAVARLFAGAVDVSATMVAEGHAWALPGDGHARFSGLQAQARANGLGLWHGDAGSAVAPWAWRESASASAASVATSAAGATATIVSAVEPEAPVAVIAAGRVDLDAVRDETLTHVTVGPGETLRGIAAAHVSSPDRVEAMAMAMAIYAANPDAFTVPNINALVAGARLRIPDVGTLSAAADTLAREHFVRHHAQWAARRGASGADTGLVETVAQSDDDDTPLATIAWANDESSAITIALPEAEPVIAELPALDVAPADDGRSVLSAAFEDVGAQMQSAAAALLAPAAGPSNETEVADRDDALRSRLSEAQRKIEDLRRMLELKDTEFATLEDSLGGSGADAGAAAPGNDLGIIPEMLGVEEHARGVRYTVWYATNRNPVHVADSVVGYGTVRDAENHYGRVVVNIPRSHEPPVMASSVEIRWIEASDGELEIERLEPMSAEAFRRDVRARLEGKSTEQRAILVYIHGFETSFEEAALRAAQLGFDLKNPGITALYSWPSRDDGQEYVADLGASEQSQDQMARFLVDLVRHSGAERVHLLAHSMGNRGLAYALQSAAFEAARKTGVAFGQIVLAAPDLHVDTFMRLAEVYREIAAGTTIYASPRHLASDLGSWRHSYDRVGFSPPLTVVDGIDTVLVEDFTLLALGDGYSAEAAAVVNDIAQVIRGGAVQGTPGRRRVTNDGPAHFVLGD